MKALIFIILFLPFIIHSQCNETKNSDGIVIMTSTDESFIGAIGEKNGDSLYVSIKKVTDVDEIRYSIFLFINSEDGNKFIEHSYIIPHMPEPEPILIGEENFKNAISNKGKYLKSVSGRITASELKRFFFADNFTFGAFGDSYEPNPLLFKKWKAKYRKCLNI